MEKTYTAKSLTLSRKTGAKKDEGLWTAFIGLFSENNPHLVATDPIEIIDIHDVEKVRLRDLCNVSYYLMGNDIVVNNLESVTLKKEGNILTLTGKQNL